MDCIRGAHAPELETTMVGSPLGANVLVKNTGSIILGQASLASNSDAVQSDDGAVTKKRDTVKSKFFRRNQCSPYCIHTSDAGTDLAVVLIFLKRKSETTNGRTDTTHTTRTRAGPRQHGHTTNTHTHTQQQRAHETHVTRVWDTSSEEESRI